MKTILFLFGTSCTDFRFFARKDADGTTAKSLLVVDKMLDIIRSCDPCWWVVENPMSRIHKLTDVKTTWLWGTFTVPERHEVEPVEGRRIWKVGGRSDATKKFRSVTPAGFANDFFEANP